MSEHNDNTLFLFVCAKESNAKFNWAEIGEVLGLKMGTASKRWQRLKDALEKEGVPAHIPASASIDETTIFLFQCISLSALKLDFNAIGNATSLKPGTAAKRYCRLLIKIKRHEAEMAAGEKGASPAVAATATATTATTATAPIPAKTAKTPAKPNHGRKRKMKDDSAQLDGKDEPEAGDKSAPPAKKVKKDEEVQKTEADSEKPDNEQK